MDPIASLLNRPKAYYNIDGVGELGTGFMCLGYALLQWMQLHSPRQAVWNQMYTLFIYVGVMAALIHYGSKAVKRRITYPRTGFVAYRTRDTVWRPMIVGCAASVLASTGLVVALRSHWDVTPACFIGLLFAGIYAFGIARTVRWKWAVVWTMAFGSLVIGLLPPDRLGVLAGRYGVAASVPAPLVAYLLTMTLFGALLLISGGISFCLYLRHTQAPAPDAQ